MCHSARLHFSWDSVHEPMEGRWCTAIASLSASVTNFPLVLHVSLPKTIFLPYLQLWKWSLEYFCPEECFQLFISCQSQWNCLCSREMMKGVTPQITEETISLCFPPPSRKHLMSIAQNWMNMEQSSDNSFQGMQSLNVFSFFPAEHYLALFLKLARHFFPDNKEGWRRYE